MKIELDIPDELLEKVEIFKEETIKAVSNPLALSLGFTPDKMDLEAVLNVLLVAGLESFKPKTRPFEGSPSTLMIDDTDKPSGVTVGMMAIDRDGKVVVDGDMPEAIREQLQSLGREFQNAIMSSSEECDCPKCQMRRAHVAKGKMS